MTAVFQSVAARRPAPRSEATDEWIRCPGCASLLYAKQLRALLHVCPDCAHHIRMTPWQRIDILLDEGSFQQFDAELAPVDVLGFTDTKPYPHRLADARKRTGNNESVVCGTGVLEGLPLVVAIMDFEFLGGSVGGTTGALIARAACRARAERTPLLVVGASGGARMQEGAVSLMQLARTSQEIGRLREDGVLCINLNTDPTYGGATASFATLGDIVLAEPGARIGFAGPKVIKQTIRQDLPEGFQTAEFLKDNGMLDLIVPREEQRDIIARILALHRVSGSGGESTAIGVPEAQVLVRTPMPTVRTPVESVRLARHTGRPSTLDYCQEVFDDFLELHGDRLGTDDLAVVGGVASLAGRPLVVIGHQKGANTQELVRRNFGMPQPSGYHKARRLMAHAERFGFPLVTFIDTPGAYPGVEAERHGQGTAIAEAILTMSRLRVPTVVLVTGEGGSGGALAIGVGDRFLMMENSYFSVISPEGCSTILFGSAAEAGRAARALRITPTDLLELGILDAIVPEPAGGAHTDHRRTIATVRVALERTLDELAGIDPRELLQRRYGRISRIGGADPTFQACTGRTQR